MQLIKHENRKFSLTPAREHLYRFLFCVEVSNQNGKLDEFAKILQEQFSKNIKDS